MVMKHVIGEYLPTTSLQKPAIALSQPQQKSEPPQAQSAQPPAAVSAAKQKGSSLVQPPQAQSAQSPAAVSAVKQKKSNLVQPPQAQSPAAARPQKPAQSPAAVPVAKQKESNLVQTQHASLPSVQENEFLPPISRWTRLGGLFIAGSVGVAIALAAFTPYNRPLAKIFFVMMEGWVKISSIVYWTCLQRVYKEVC